MVDVDQAGRCDGGTRGDGSQCGHRPFVERPVDGLLSWKMKRFWDEPMAPYWMKVDGKIACVFSSSGGWGGGTELACQSLLTMLIDFDFLCPTSKEAATVDAVTHYIAMSGIGHDAAWQPAGAAGNSFMGYERLTSVTMIKDGTSNTIALMETRVGLGPWARGGPSSDLGDGGADRGAESRGRVHLRGLEQLAVPPGGLRDRGALARTSAVPTLRLFFEMSTLRELRCA